MTNVQLRVEGMSCGHCVGALTKELAALPGVTELHVEVGSARFVVEGPPDEPAIRHAVDEAGFEVAELRATTGG